MIEDVVSTNELRSVEKLHKFGQRGFMKRISILFDTSNIKYLLALWLNFSINECN